MYLRCTLGINTLESFIPIIRIPVIGILYFNQYKINNILNFKLLNNKLDKLGKYIIIYFNKQKFLIQIYIIYIEIYIY